MKNYGLALSAAFVIGFNLCSRANADRPMGGMLGAQGESFVRVEGPDLKSRMDSASRLAAAASLRSYWVAYAFDPKPNIDFDSRKVDASWNQSIKGPSISLNVAQGSRNVGAFLLLDSGSQAIVRLEIYNLDRTHDFGGQRVYWLQQARAQESLSLLKSLTEPGRVNDLLEKAVIGIGLHNDPGANPILEEIARRETDYQIRHWAICWLGQAKGEMDFLAGLALDSKEPYKIRWKVLDAIQHSPDPAAASTLERIYQTTDDPALRKDVLMVAFLNVVNPNLDDAVRFLADVAGRDALAASRQQALTSLDKVKGQHVPRALSDLIQSADIETEVQERAINAIGNGPKDEAIPLLIQVVKSHPKPELRRQAISRLGQISDPRVVEFLRDTLKGSS